MYLCKKFIKVYIDVNLVKETKDYFEFLKTDIQFAWTKLDIGTVAYCLKYLNDDIFKIYCILLYRFNKYQYKNRNNFFPEPFKFSRAQICRSMGISENWGPNITRVTFGLETLASLNLIVYDAGPFYIYDDELDTVVPWMYLYKVNLYSDPQKNVAKTIIKENRKIDKMNDEDKAMIAAPIQDMSEKEIKKLQGKPSLKDHNWDYYNELTRGNKLLNIGEDNIYRDVAFQLCRDIRSYLLDGKISNLNITDEARKVCIGLFNYDYCDELVGK